MWSKLDDRLHENPKIGALSDKAFRVYILSITYSSSRKTKGILSPLEVKTILRLAMADESVVDELLKLNAWENGKTDGKPDFAMNFAIHDYGKYNPEDLHDKRSLAGKLGAQKRWQNGKTIANANDVPPMAKWQNDGKVHGKGSPVPVPEDSNVKDSSANNDFAGVGVSEKSTTSKERKPSRNGKEILTPDLEDWFVRCFYPAYPRKRESDDARRAIHAINPDEATRSQIITALNAYKSKEWRNRPPDKVPYPASWLNSGGWKDVDFDDFDSRGELNYGD